MVDSSSRRLDLPGYWQRLEVAGRSQRVGTAHLFPRFYYTAFCGFNAERTAAGFHFELLEAIDIDRRCERCRKAAAGSRFNTADASPKEGREGLVSRR